MFKKISIFLYLLIANICGLMAQIDSIRVTLLTCSPGQEVYELYGHTAIRCQAFQSGAQEEATDIIFNYGVFDMSKPHFIWHFMMGQTDYIVQPVPLKYFVTDYVERGSSITEQELNLTLPEARRLMERLTENCLPENRNYRYNFLYKNCTTMVRDMVEDAITGQIQYPDTLPHQTFREILHRYTTGYPWVQEGCDVLIGSEVDTILSAHAAMFVPENLMRAFDGAFIRTPRGDMRPLVRKKTVLLEAEPQPVEPGFPLLPWQMMLAFGGLCLLIMLLEVWTERVFWLWDVLLLLLQGTAGTLITFMLFFSEHPAVGSNWQAWLLNPIALTGIPFVIKAAIQHETTRWHAFYFTVLASFLLFSPWIPQVFAKITVPLALCLLTRPAGYYLVKTKQANRKKAKRIKH